MLEAVVKAVVTRLLDLICWMLKRLLKRLLLLVTGFILAPQFRTTTIVSKWARKLIDLPHRQYSCYLHLVKHTVWWLSHSPLSISRLTRLASSYATTIPTIESLPLWNTVHTTPYQYETKRRYLYLRIEHPQRSPRQRYDKPF